MTENNLHNLMTQMTQEQKSLWRIERNYINEAETDEEKTMWELLRDNKKEHIAEMHKLIKSII